MNPNLTPDQDQEPTSDSAPSQRQHQSQANRRQHHSQAAIRRHLQPVPKTPSSQPLAKPEKNYLVALFLSYFLGSIGADRFYLGKNWPAIAKLLTLWWSWYLGFIDLFLVALANSRLRMTNRPLEGFAKKTALGQNP